MTRTAGRARELRGQLAVLALALWTVAAVNACTPDRYLRSGQLKGTDFVHFFTLGVLAGEDVARFDDATRVRALQVEVVPESKDLDYPPVYGPQVSLALAPLGRLSYGQALTVWLGLTTLAYLGVVWIIARQAESVSTYVDIILLGALAFPPFWQLLQHGQLSGVAVLSVAGAAVALRRGQSGVAGLCLGVLAYKPPLIAPVLLVLLVARSWRTLAAVAVVAAGQVALAGIWVGIDGLTAYARLLVSLPAAAQLMAAKPEQMHSLRTFWELLVPWTAPMWALYAMSAAAAIAMAAAVWRTASDTRLKMAALVLATVLAAPHLYVYDLVILAPVWIWLVDWSLRTSPGRHVTWLLYVGYLAPLASPLVGWVPVQISTICFAALLASLRWPASARSPLSGHTTSAL